MNLHHQNQTKIVTRLSLIQQYKQIHQNQWIIIVIRLKPCFLQNETQFCTVPKRNECGMLFCYQKSAPDFNIVHFWTSWFVKKRCSKDRKHQNRVVYATFYEGMYFGVVTNFWCELKYIWGITERFIWRCLRSLGHLGLILALIWGTSRINLIIVGLVLLWGIWINVCFSTTKLLVIHL